MIRCLARALWSLAQALPYDPEEDPDLGPLSIYLHHRYGRDPLTLFPEEWEEGLLDFVAERIAEGREWYGVPSAARDPEGGGYIASAEGPGGPFIVRAKSKWEAYRMAWKEWVRRLLE
ncbi:hypothetical protein [Thermus sp.]|uniref:hypothetical protein n=1 Tax=Thermus sp. TaxID=275 RepID=UPI003D11EC66